MNLNSDSGVPFLGLQMSVDARDFSTKSSDDSVTTVAMSTRHHQAPLKTQASLKTQSARAQSPQWVSIPASPSNVDRAYNSHTVLADEDPIAEIERRLSAF